MKAICALCVRRILEPIKIAEPTVLETSAMFWWIIIIWILSHVWFVSAFGNIKLARFILLLKRKFPNLLALSRVTLICYASDSIMLYNFYRCLNILLRNLHIN